MPGRRSGVVVAAPRRGAAPLLRRLHAAGVALLLLACARHAHGAQALPSRRACLRASRRRALALQPSPTLRVSAAVAPLR